MGCAVANADVIRQLSKVKIRHEVSGVSARMVEYLLDNVDVMEEYVAEVVAARDRLADLLGGIGYAVLPSRSSAVVIRIPDGVDRARLDAELRIRGIEVSSGLSAPHERHIRVSVGPWALMLSFAEGLRDATSAALRPRLDRGLSTRL